MHERRRERGLALVLVLTVVLALAIVATPFVLSMLLQERSGTVSRYVSQAEFGVEGARNFAMWRLMQSLDPIERRSGPVRTYHFDERGEFDVRLDEFYLDNNRRNAQGQQSSLDIANPQGSIWGLTVQDEQGKLNVRTAPLGAIHRVKQLVDGRAGNHQDFLTLYSGRDASWVVPQRIRSMGTRQQGQNVGQGVWCDSLHVLAPGSRVRITKSGVPQPMYAVVTGNPILGTGATGLTTNPMIPQSMMEGVIEVEYRHPVNINTARREVLIAVFEGLNLFNQPTSLIDAATAVQLANLFYGQRVTRLEDFLLRLAGAGLNPMQLQAVGLNAVCPSWAHLNGSGTVPFSFRSYDVHTVETYASQNNPAGVQVAGRGVREVVSVSPPNLLTLTCESQWDFDRMLLGVAAAVQRRDLLGYPYGNLVTTHPNMLISPFQTAEFVRLGPLTALWDGAVRTGEVTTLTVVGLWKIVLGQIDRKNIGGPIQIAVSAGEQARQGLPSLAFFTAVISVNLFVLNLLPVPMLDGGHLLFFLCEAVLGRPLSVRKREVAQQVGFVLLMLLMVYAVYNDLERIGLIRFFR